MKKIWAKLAIFCVFCSCTNIVLANEKLSKQHSISERLQVLRARLDNFQKVTKVATKSTEECETVELKLKPIKVNFETLSSNIETRKDVKMITLFHDPEFDVVVKPDLSIKKKPITIDDLRQKFRKDTSNTKLRVNRIREMVARIR